MKVSICDFDDSFTYNIFSELSLLGVNSTVIPFSNIKDFLQNLINTDEKHVVVLGPGPGHPSEYLFLQETVLNLLKNSNIFIMGICLGHQLLWYYQGLEVSQCIEAIHGKVQTYHLTPIWHKEFGKTIEVQRYNSLAVKVSNYEAQKLKDKGVKFFLEKNECIITAYNNFVSYQFHPESIGTSCPKVFFKPVLDFLL